MESSENSTFVSMATQDLQNLPEEMMIILNQGPFDSNVESNEDLTVARYVAVAGENGCTFELIPDTSTSPQPQDNEDSNTSLVSKDTSIAAPSTSLTNSDPTLVSEVSSKKDEPKTNISSRKIPFNEKLELMTKLRAEGHLICPLEGCQSSFNKFRLYKHHFKRCQIDDQHTQANENVNNNVSSSSMPLLEDLIATKQQSPSKAMDNVSEEVSVKKSSPTKSEKRKISFSSPSHRETRSKRARRKSSDSFTKGKDILSFNEEESDDTDEIPPVRKKRKSPFKQRKQIIVDSSEEEIELVDNIVKKPKPHRKPIVNKNKTPLNKMPIQQRSIPLPNTDKAPRGIQRLLDNLNDLQSPTVATNKPGSFSFSRDWGKCRKMYTKGDESLDVRDMPTEELFDKEPSNEPEETVSEGKSKTPSKKKSILHSSTDSSNKNTRVKHTVRFQQLTTVLNESEEGTKNASKVPETSSSIDLPSSEMAVSNNKDILGTSLPSLSTFANSSLLSTESGTTETTQSNSKNKSLKVLDNLESETNIENRAPHNASDNNLQFSSSSIDLNVSQASTLTLENTFETDSNSQNIAPNSKLADDPSKTIESKPLQKNNQSYSKKSKHKVVHDIYQLPPITANKADISMNSFLDSPKIDTVVFSSLTNIKEKHKRPYIKTENENDSEANDSTLLPENDFDALYSDPTLENSQNYKIDFEIDNLNDNSDSMDIDSPLPIEEEEEEEKPEPEYDEEAKKKLYFSLRWSRGRNRVKILENLKDGKSIEPFFKQAELSSMRGLRGRGRPRGSRAVPRIHHNSDGGAISSISTRGRGRGRGRPRGVRGRPRLQRNFIEETKQQAPKILEMIRPYINNTNSGTKVLIIPSSTGVSNTSNMLVVRANLQSINSDSPDSISFNTTNASNLTSLELIKSALQNSGQLASTIDEHLNYPSTSSSEPNPTPKSKRKGRQKLVPDSSDEEAPEGPFFCGACRYENDDFQAMRRHIWVEHYGLARINNYEPYTHNECVSRLRKAFKKFSQIRCKVEGCKKLFNNPSTYINHTVSCGKENPYVNCEICSKSLKPSSMMSHMKSFHSKVEAEDEIEFSDDDDMHELNLDDSSRRKAARQALVNVRNFIRRENMYEIPNREDSGSDYINSDADIEVVYQKDQTIEALSDASQISSNASCIYPFKSKLVAWEGHWSGPNYVVSPADLIEKWQQHFAKDKAVTCEVENCNKQFSSIQELQRHSCAGNLQPWNCNLCDEDFEFSFNLYHHLDDYHFDKADQALLQERRRKLVPLTKAMDWTLENLITSYHNKLFQHLRPIQLLPLDQEKYENFLTKESHSLHFKTIVSETGEERQWQRLERFHSHSDYKSHNYSSFFVGGTIKCASWCPIPPGAFVTQYLAVGTIPEYSFNKGCEKSTIQVWDMGYMTFNRASKLPTLSFALAIEAGDLVDLNWCPTGSWEDPTQIKEDARLGFLAVGFKTGHVHIYSLPNPETSKNTPEMPLFKSEPSKILCPPNAIKDNNISCNKISWHPNNSCRNILAAFSNGLVCVWNLEEDNNGNREIITSVTFQAHQNSITGLYWGSITESVVYTTCADGILKSWDLKDMEKPQNTYELGQLSDVKWIPYWNGVIVTQNTPVNGTFFKSLSPDPIVNLNLNNANIESVSTSSWLNCQITGDKAGEVVGMVLPSLTRNMDYLKPFYRFCFPIFRSEIYELPNDMVEYPCLEDLNRTIILQLQVELENIESKIKSETQESGSDFLKSLLEKEFSKDLELIGSVIHIIKEEWSDFVNDIAPELDVEGMNLHAAKLTIALKQTFTALEEILNIDCSASFFVPILKQINELSSSIVKCLEDISLLFNSRCKSTSTNVETNLFDNELLDYLKRSASSWHETLEKAMEENHLNAGKQSDPIFKEDFYSAKQKYGIVITEQNLKRLRKIPPEEFQRLKKPETMNAPSDSIYPMNSLTTICWNPNLGSHLWVFSGGKSGIGKVSLISGLYQPTMEVTVKRAHVWFTEQGKS